MFTRSKPARSVVDPATLEREERSIDTREAQLRAHLAELDFRAVEAWGAIEEARKALAALTHSRAAGMAVEAMGRLPSAAAESLRSAVLPERERADRARTEALEARKAALAAEERTLAAREEQLQAWHKASAAGLDTARAIGTRAAELEAEAAKAPKSTPAAAPAAPLPKAAAKPPAAPEPSRRRAERVRFETEVDLESESNFFTGFSTDLSDGGIFIATSKVAQHGAEVDLAFTLPGGRRIEARGVVRWVRDFNPSEPELMPGVGIEFASIDEAARKAVADFTGRREPLFWVA